MKNIYLVIPLLFLVSCNNNAIVENNEIIDAPSCNISKSSLINFRNSKIRDTLLVSIKGEPCYKAELTIRILTNNNEILYNYKQPFEKHVAIQWDDPLLADVANDFIDRLLKNNIELASSLPPFSASEIPDNKPIGFEYTIKVNEKTYGNIVASNKPVFRHLTHYEEWRYIVYDAKSGKGIVIIDCGY